MREKALFLAPEPPFPTCGGGPLRTASLLTYLAERYDVHLVTFVPEDQPSPEPDLPPGLVDHFTCVYLPVHSRGRAARIYRNTGRVLRGQLPLTDRFCGAESLARVAAAIDDHEYELAVVEHFWCAPYVEILRPRARHIVLDLHNIESVLHERCSRTEPWPQNLGHQVFRRTARREERRRLSAFDMVLTASDSDQAELQRIAPGSRSAVYPNAIPLRAKPDVDEEFAVGFSANFEYHPNITGVKYFMSRVWPQVRGANPGLRWRLIGKNENAVAGVIAGDERIECTGAVPDAIAEIARCQLMVVPLLAGSGTRMKILEAWAAARAVVSTPLGAEGLPAADGTNLRIAADAESMARTVSELLAKPDERRRLGEGGRRTYESALSWPAAWRSLEPILNGLAIAAAAS